ncbi:N-formylglutamate deformylase [Ramlibacter sp.]|uniref:N-formylglutamate deformylase n=1 Tax=Ramlibacter sp. TaxID=1917967 RepID=UPI002C678803|nr:N-formylglutamate deformylase [Ramlibacter sp.]HWI82024.1 N-formylglutamate deformylase [Ramlibacter sp.]
MSFDLHRGSSPLLVSMPHVGTEIPADLRERYLPRALAVEDADWHLHQLYDWLPALGSSVLRPRYARYVIDLNRPPDDAPMYPGASNTELCPTRFFDGTPLYRPGQEPGPEERLRRRAGYWQPYHDALAAELDRIRGEHGYVLLWDAHSIRSVIPWLFEGRLPDLNIGTAGGTAADPSVGEAVRTAAAAAAGAFTHALNGRFKGGYITRRYGAPQRQVQAVQLEMCQCTYMSETAPFGYDEAAARRVQPVVRSMMEAAIGACRALYGR